MADINRYRGIRMRNTVLVVLLMVIHTRCVDDLAYPIPIRACAIYVCFKVALIWLIWKIKGESVRSRSAIERGKVLDYGRGVGRWHTEQ